MTAPAFIFSFLLATMFGSAFHFWKGGGGGRLVFSLLLAWGGFYLGHRLGMASGMKFLMIGPVYGGFGVLGSLVFLFLGYWILQLDT